MLINKYLSKRLLFVYIVKVDIINRPLLSSCKSCESAMTKKRFCFYFKKLNGTQGCSTPMRNAGQLRPHRRDRNAR